jgi:hypothetical protein
MRISIQNWSTNSPSTQPEEPTSHRLSVCDRGRVAWSGAGLQIFTDQSSIAVSNLLTDHIGENENQIGLNVYSVLEYMKVANDETNVRKTQTELEKTQNLWGVSINTKAVSLFVHWF